MSKPPQESEATIQARIRKALAVAGFTVVHKTHGNEYQQGWPDLYAFHPARGHRWIEVKRPSGSFTDAQRARFACWDAAGVDVHVLCDADLAPLYRPGNWKEWLSKPQLAHFEARKRILAPTPRMTNWEDWQ